MAFKEVQSGSNTKSYWPKKAAERKPGDAVEGIYKSSQERPGFAGNTETLYILETKEGNVGVSGHASIARKMAQIPVGSLVRIVFNGKQTNPKTGRQYNDFSVFLDDSVQPSPEDGEVDFGGLDF